MFRWPKYSHHNQCWHCNNKSVSSVELYNTTHYWLGPWLGLGWGLWAQLVPFLWALAGGQLQHSCLDYQACCCAHASLAEVAPHLHFLLSSMNGAHSWVTSDRHMACQGEESHFPVGHPIVLTVDLPVDPPVGLIVWISHPRGLFCGYHYMKCMA